MLPRWPGHLERKPPLRDATAAELRSEPEIVLQELAQGGMGVTPTTQQLAKAELAVRRLRPRR